MKSLRQAGDLYVAYAQENPDVPLEQAVKDMVPKMNEALGWAPFGQRVWRGSGLAVGATGVAITVACIGSGAIYPALFFAFLTGVCRRADETLGARIDSIDAVVRHADAIAQDYR